MTTTRYIEARIEKMPKGEVFSWSDVLPEPGKQEAVIKALNRMVDSGNLGKITKGKYYKPEATVYGPLEPGQNQVVKDLLESNGKVTGYLTGYSIYNKLGLTTQVSNLVQIGKKDVRPQFSRGRYTISFIKQKNDITTDNIPLLQILDAIRYIKKIPDTPFKIAFKRLLHLIQNLSDGDKKKLAKLLLKYPAATRALTGAMFEITEAIELSEKIRSTLNPVTVYKMPGIDTLIKNAKNWNFK